MWKFAYKVNHFISNIRLQVENCLVFLKEKAWMLRRGVFACWIKLYCEFMICCDECPILFMCRSLCFLLPQKCEIFSLNITFNLA